MRNVPFELPRLTDHPTVVLLVKCAQAKSEEDRDIADQTRTWGRFPVPLNSKETRYLPSTTAFLVFAAGEDLTVQAILYEDKREIASSNVWRIHVRERQSKQGG
jgi:hypothetical protein